jgi:hypothetical protein
MVEKVNNDKSNANIDLFKKLVKTFDLAVGNYFNHIMPYIKQQDEHLS